MAYPYVPFPTYVHSSFPTFSACIPLETQRKVEVGKTLPKAAVRNLHLTFRENLADQ